MNNKTETTNLNPEIIDYLTVVTKGALGAIPFAGSLLAELAGTVIPNQRTDRMARFLEVLDKKLESLDKKFVRIQLTNENFSDILEEGFLQAVHSLTDERREYIASLVANSLSMKDIEYIESKHLLRLLGDLNDVEIIWLRYYLEPYHGDENEFYNKHSLILEPIMATFGAPLSVVDKKALQTSYTDHLLRLGLLKPRYEVDSKTHMTEFDHFTGGLKIRYYEITPLGRLLLRQIGFSIPEE